MFAIQKNPASESCGGVSVDAAPSYTSLTVWERRLLDEAGVDTLFPASKKRRLGEGRGLHVDTW